MTMQKEVDKINAKPEFFLMERMIYKQGRAELNDNGSMNMGLNFPVCEVHEAVKDPEVVLNLLIKGAA